MNTTPRLSYAEEYDQVSVHLSVTELIDDAEYSLFRQLMYNENHVLHQLLPARQHSHYKLRPRNHDRLLTQEPNSTVESDFIICMLFGESY